MTDTTISEELANFQAALAILQASVAALVAASESLVSLPEFVAYVEARDARREAGMAAENARDRLVSTLNGSYF